MLSGVVSLHFTSFAIGYAVQVGSGSDMCYIFHSEKFIFSYMKLITVLV